MTATTTETATDLLGTAPEPTAEARRIMPDDLRRFVQRVFQQLGVPEDRAARAANVLLTADLRGVTSHGVARLNMYYGQILSGAIDPTATLTTVRETGATGVYDAHGGLALALAPEAMDQCIE